MAVPGTEKEFRFGVFLTVFLIVCPHNVPCVPFVSMIRIEIGWTAHAAAQFVFGRGNTGLLMWMCADGDGCHCKPVY